MLPSSSMARVVSINLPLNLPAKAFLAKEFEMLCAISNVVTPDSNSRSAPSGKVMLSSYLSPFIFYIIQKQIRANFSRKIEKPHPQKDAVAWFHLNLSNTKLENTCVRPLLAIREPPFYVCIKSYRVVSHHKWAPFPASRHSLNHLTRLDVSLKTIVPQTSEFSRIFPLLASPRNLG